MFNHRFWVPITGVASLLAIILTGCQGRGQALAQTQPLLTESGPLLKLGDTQISPEPFIIAYGDMRFTSPMDRIVSNPKVRRWLVNQIAAEKPDALLISGDVPFRGAEKDDYKEFAAETVSWRAANLFVIPALGNHEVNGRDKQLCLENWWAAFPEVRGHRWYAAALGTRIYALNLDSTSSLKEGSEQQTWIKDQLMHLPVTTKFVFINLHNPPAADNQPEGDADHNERPNELALAALLTSVEPRYKAQFIVVAGHIHNYERFLRHGIVYLVSGGGGAEPRKIHRHEGDLFQDAPEVNYHYVRFRLHGNQMDAEMVRVADPEGDKPVWEVRDRFSIASQRQ